MKFRQIGKGGNKTSLSWREEGECCREVLLPYCNLATQYEEYI
jgi:hypothetical protein